MLRTIRQFLTKSIYRRVLTGFGVITALILVATASSYLGLSRVRTISAQTISISEGIVHVQEYALAVEAVEENLDRLSVTGGQDAADAIYGDLATLNAAAAAIKDHTPEALVPKALALTLTTDLLAAEIEALIEMRNLQATSRSINEQTIAVYSALRSARQTQEELTEETLLLLERANTVQQRTMTTMRLTMMGVGAASLVVAAGASYGISRAIVNPLSDMVGSATQIAQGDYTRQVQISTQDEVGQLATAFNHMTGAVRTREAELQAQTERLTQANQELTIARKAAEEASRLKDEFLSVMSHELRTPLNAVMGYQGILELMGQLDAESLEMVQRTQANARRLLDLINDVLDISRIEAGRMELVPMALNVDQFIQHIQSQMDVLAREKQLGFHVEIDSAMPSAIYVDEDALTKILVNLLGNAFKFTEEGGVSLTMRADDDQMVIHVADTGIGIPVYMHEIIFERFRQVDGTSTRKHGGSGLGLSIVQQICHLMGGKITVDSDTGRGSTFTVRLPLQPAAEAEGVA